MSLKYCPDCNAEVSIGLFRIKGKKKDGTNRYEKYCKEHSRLRDRIRKQKGKQDQQEDLIEPTIVKTIPLKSSKTNPELELETEDIASFNEFIGMLKEEFERLKGQKVYVKT